MLSDASLAQLVEQLTLNQRVTGSSPAGGILSPCDISRGLFVSCKSPVFLSLGDILFDSARYINRLQLIIFTT